MYCIRFENIDESKKKEMKEKEYVSDVIEEEDLRELFILYLKHMKIDWSRLILSDLSVLSKNNLSKIFSL